LALAIVENCWGDDLGLDGDTSDVRGVHALISALIGVPVSEWSAAGA
jgi:hypothetical protein